MPAGRPTDYRPEFCEQAIELGAEGKSKAQIAAKFDVMRQTLDDWAIAHPAFHNAMSRARELSLSWWEDQGQRGIWSGSDFNANAYRLQIMNRFPADYRDKTDIDLSGTVTVEVTRFATIEDGQSRIIDAHEQQPTDTPAGE